MTPESIHGVLEATEKNAVREQAIGRIRTAKRIFIAYESPDLSRVRDLRSRILKLRQRSAANTVFMASDSLPIGGDVSPEQITTQLSRADLFVIACGPTTANSSWVHQEVQQALEQRRKGKTVILPVILKPGVRLPPGIDFEIHAIHLTTLFPAIKWVRIAAVAAIAASLGLAAL